MICRNTPPVLTIMLENLLQHQFAFHRYYILIIFNILRKRDIVCLSVDYLPIWFSVDIGQYNCTLFKGKSKCIRFDDTYVTVKLFHDVLLNGNNQKNIQIVFLVRGTRSCQQAYTSGSRMPWEL